MPRSISSHRFSIGLISSDCAGQLSKVKSLSCSLNHLRTMLDDYKNDKKFTEICIRIQRLSQKLLEGIFPVFNAGWRGGASSRKVSGGSKLRNEIGVGCLWAVVETGSLLHADIFTALSLNKKWTSCTTFSVPRRILLKFLFILENKKKSSGAISGLYGGWGNVAIPILGNNSETMRVVCGFTRCHDARSKCSADSPHLKILL
ncbi:hypothetical protein TNCV_2932481 [Trichonephila clavipes]|nr:hypothetical protein TNCV_2932481 [Trichonephila clavipes]